MALKRISAASNYNTIFVLKCLTENFGFNIFRKYVELNTSSFFNAPQFERFL